MKMAGLFMILLGIALSAAGAPDRVIADFEGPGYPAGWTIEGKALGAGPARGTLPNQQAVSGFAGEGLVNTYLDGDRTTGTLTSTPFDLDRRYLNLLIGGGADPVSTCAQLIVDGQVVRTASGQEDERLAPVTWDILKFAGKKGVIRIVDRATGGWGHINIDQIVLSDTARATPTRGIVIRTDVLYDETFRPQFHFTAKKGWLNDPNGLVYHRGVWHLFFQHNPLGNQWGNMTWGHAVSKDLVHWEQRPHAIERDELGDIFSGSAVVDWENTAGFGREAIICFYTSAGGQGPMSRGKPFTQSMAYSTDGGKTFHKYQKNPILGNISADNRDPKVFWHAPTRRWIMALYVPVNERGKKIHTVQFFGSANLKEWTFLSRVDDFYECPDLFELAVDGDQTDRKWVLFGADGQYLIGRFDGQQFIKEAGKFRSDWGKNFYAAQTYSDAPDHRRVLIGWMREGKYPGMPFNQQMSFPVELSLRKTPQGVRMFKMPVKEIQQIHGRSLEERSVEGDLFDIDARFEVKDQGTAGIDVRGTRIIWSNAKLSMPGSEALLALPDGKLRLRVLVDRTSIEVFANDGEVAISSCFLPPQENRRITPIIEGDAVKLVSWKAVELRSAWKPN